MPILDPLVSKPKFEKAVYDLREVERRYRKVWRLREPQYPLIFLDMLSCNGRPLFTLMLDMRDWDFLPPCATIVDRNTLEPLPPQRIPAAASMSDAAAGHLIRYDAERRLAFCSPGFQEYHSMTPEDPWEGVRGTDRGTIVGIVEQACNMINRPSLPGGGQARRQGRKRRAGARAIGMRGRQGGGIPAVRLPRDVLVETIDGLREFGKRGRERHALWAGREEDGAFAVCEVVFPNQQSTAASYEVSDQEMFRVCRDAGRSGMAVMCQVHTHPARAFHSRVDNEGSALALPGSLSVVIPNYAEGRADEPSGWAAYVFDGSVWRRLRPKEVKRAFRVK